ncbi:transposase [Taibaiella koreensis]|uniref:transposase n=1 Tax=Taibaiella koreensis TaxID=1268548 RepID=UPI000E59F4F4|nr:transposase [Taibaiella koreensis]
MAELYHNRYRIPSSRLATWDYTSEGMYFVTICTHRRAHYFGEIVETPCMASDQVVVPETPGMASDQVVVPETPGMASLRPTAMGLIAEQEWYRTMALRTDMRLQSGEFVVMPNHIHGILIIGANPFNQGIPANQNRFGPQSHNLASVIRGYKSAVTIYARQNGICFNWQSRFHDHIIRSYEEYERIARYIRNNPQKWASDKWYTPHEANAG